MRRCWQQVVRLAWLARLAAFLRVYLPLQGIRETTISAWMGHQTDAMKARYRHLFPEETRKEMAQLFAAR